MTRTATLATLCIISSFTIGALPGHAGASPLILQVSPTGFIPDAFSSLTEALEYSRDQEAELTMVYLEYAYGMYDSAHEAFPFTIERTVYLQTIGESVFASASFEPEEGFAFVLSDSAKLVLSRVQIDGNYQGKGIQARANSELVACCCHFYQTTGAYVGHRSYAEFIKCDFHANIAGGTSAGIRMEVNHPTRPHLIVTDCDFTWNMSDCSPCISWFDWYYAMAGSAIVSDSVFTNNSGGYGCCQNYYLMGDCGLLGAGSYTGRAPDYGTAYTLTNCLLLNNNTTWGTFAIWGGRCIVQNSTLIDHELTARGYGWGQNMTQSSILWGTGTSANYDGQYCCVQGGLEGEGNIDLDPIFSSDDQSSQEYFLSSTAAGQDVDSPCIDAGGVSVEEAGMQFYTTRTDFVPDTGIVDMGFHYRIAPRIVMDVEEADGAYCVFLSGSASRYIEANVDVYLAVITPTAEILTFSAGEWTREISPILSNLTLQPRAWPWHGPFFLDEIAVSGDPRFSEGDHTLVAVMCHPGTLEYACELAIYDLILD